MVDTVNHLQTAGNPFPIPCEQNPVSIYPPKYGEAIQIWMALQWPQIQNVEILFTLSRVWLMNESVTQFGPMRSEEKSGRDLGSGGLITKSCSTLVTSWTVVLPGSSFHGILQARILEWVAISFSRGSSQESNPGLLHCRQILYWLSHKGKFAFVFERSGHAPSPASCMDCEEAMPGAVVAFGILGGAHLKSITEGLASLCTDV